MRHATRVPRAALLAVFALAALSQAAAPAAEEEADWGLPADGASGNHRYTNRLIDSRDPYLLLHAHNPVDWYPWGAEALAKAKEEQKPIFLSIGYSTCYWCHVAERVIYSDPEIARLMNRWFVNIKVDREQRPDIDRIYMLATQLMTGHGGWPNNVFLTPELEPFFGGSYFPPQDDPRIGPGFPTILTAIHAAWEEHRTDQVMPVAERLFAALQRVQQSENAAGAAPVEPLQWLARASAALQRRFDPENGGFGASGPKFPEAPSLELLLADYRRNRDAALRDRLIQTLDAMALGGIHDQLGGGFHRYSTEPNWAVPHFEKMLYDNAQLLHLYAAAYQSTGEPLYRAVALDIGQYLKRGMMAPEGGFFTAQDSQVKGAEGAAYLWRREEVVAILGEAAAKKFFAVYTLTPMPRPGVPTGSAGAEEKESGVLRVRLPLAGTPTRAGFSDAAKMLQSLAPERAMLLAARERRQQPARDDKIITALNGLAIGAFAKSGNILQQPQFLTWARMAAERIWALAFDRQTGALQHEIFRGHAQTDGYLADYAMLGDGFMALFEVTKEAVWRERAAALAVGLLDRFAHPDGALSASPDEKNLPIAIAESEDSDVPSGTSVALDLLLRLAAATGEARYDAAAERVVRHLSGQLDNHPDVWPAAVAAASLRPLKEPELAPAATAPSAVLFHLPETRDHVRASAAVASGPAEDRIIVTLEVDDGYHINANPASFDYLIATTVAFDRLTPTHIEYPKPVRFNSAFAPDGLDVYEGTVPVVATFPKGTLRAQQKIEGAATAQACDTQICLPPSTLPVSVSGTGG